MCSRRSKTFIDDTFFNGPFTRTTLTILVTVDSKMPAFVDFTRAGT
ncbi:hypothetical protein [Providencia stuartii]|nr:hypothetical protein [Providencia stuartii]